jgi:hypothetical protein
VGAAGRGCGLVGILWGHPQAEVSHPAEWAAPRFPDN